MTINNLASAIAKKEGKKSQARIGDIREMLKIIILMEMEAISGAELESPTTKIRSRAHELLEKKKAKEKKKKK